MTTGERIKKRREELGLTQTDLAERMGYKSRAAICTVEKDKEDLTTTRIRRFAEALQTTPAYLMGWEDEIQEIDTVLPVYEEDQSIKKAIELYRAYNNVNPDVRAAVDLMLKSAQPKP